MSAHVLNEVDKDIKKMLAHGKIGDSKSPYGAPMRFVPKPDGNQRPCVDNRNPKKLKILNKDPRPLMDEL